ncbi:unnamed protein product [Camellia sinensis]
MLSGIKMRRECPTITHLFFADDALLFAKANRRECQALKAILDAYSFASGQSINFEKSGILFSANTPEGVKSEITNLLGMSPSIRGTKYLGLSLFWGRSKSEAFGYLIEKVVTKMQGWK